MLNLIQYPTGHCFLNKLPNIVMSAGNSVSMSVWLIDGGGMRSVFAGRYQPDFDGKISVDISGIVKNHLKAMMPTNDGDLYQSGFEAHFIFKADEDYGGGDFASAFFVVNASPDTSPSLED